MHSPHINICLREHFGAVSFSSLGKYIDGSDRRGGQGVWLDESESSLEGVNLVIFTIISFSATT